MIAPALIEPFVTVIELGEAGEMVIADGSRHRGPLETWSFSDWASRVSIPDKSSLSPRTLSSKPSMLSGKLSPKSPALSRVASQKPIPQPRKSIFASMKRSQSLRPPSPPSPAMKSSKRLQTDPKLTLDGANSLAAELERRKKLPRSASLFEERRLLRQDIDVSLRTLKLIKGKRVL